jgi:FixJ family two-component response regulator
LRDFSNAQASNFTYSLSEKQRHILSKLVDDYTLGIAVNLSTLSREADRVLAEVMAKLSLQPSKI